MTQTRTNFRFSILDFGLEKGRFGFIVNPKSKIQNLKSPVLYFSTRGFTLLELLVSVTIFTGLLGALLLSFMIGRTSFLSADAYIEVQQEARRGIDAMVTELREAGDIKTAAGIASGTLTFRTALGFDLTAIVGCPASQVCWGAVDPLTNTSDCTLCVEYSVSQGQLLRRVVGGGTCGSTCGTTLVGSARVLANNVTGPGAPFLYNSADKVVIIQLQVKKVSPQLPSGETGTATLNSRVKLRNNS
ncbi:MAG: type II secretion system protein [Candidatus Omnitrophica bacterium]|nr:type II secretion system protein [Candidatus Omnitrophota bacterium]